MWPDLVCWAMDKALNAKRVNLVNTRKEFFRVGLDEVRDEVLKSFPDAEFLEVREAKEYRETLAIREQLESARATAADRYPDEL